MDEVAEHFVDQDGVPCTVHRRIAATAQDEAHVVLLLEDGREVSLPESLLTRDAASGDRVLPLRLADVAGQTDDAATRIIPIIAEEMDVHKQVRETGRVRVSKRVHEHEETIDLPLQQETIEVRRVPREQFVESRPETRREGDITIIPLVEEVLVVEKRLMLREEIHLIHRREEVRSPQTVTLRREEAEIERLPGEQAPSQ